jgi:flagellar basal-body rod protein FlgB
MPINLNSYLGVHAEALRLQSRRTEVLATNLANADTPNFKARDLDFRAALAAAAAPGASGAPLPLATTNAGHVGSNANGTSSTELKYRVPLGPSLDGNTVDVQLEQAAFAENSVRYQTTLSILSQRFKGLLTAITGQ